MEVKYIEFSRPRPSKSGKTRIWRVLAFHDISLTDSYSLGEIKFYGAWRRYTFFPAYGTFFEHACGHKIFDFCEAESRKLWKKWAKRRKARAHDGPNSDD